MKNELKEKFHKKNGNRGSGSNSQPSCQYLEYFETKKKLSIHVFTKCLQFLSYDEMAQVLAENGFDGADLTVRQGGQVLPENVETDLPKAIKALKKNGIGTNMISDMPRWKVEFRGQLA